MLLRYFNALGSKERNILVIVDSGMGNAVLALPAIGELRRLNPGVRICVSGPARNIGLICSDKIADEFITIDGNVNIFRQIVRNSIPLKRYRDCYCFFSSCGNRVELLQYLRLVGRVHRIEIPAYGREEPEWLMNLKLVGAAANPEMLEFRSDLHLTAEERDGAARFLRERGLDDFSLLIHPGWIPGKAIKALPVELVADVIDWSLKQGTVPALLLGPEEKAFFDRSGIALPPGCRIISEPIGGRMLAGVISHAGVMLAADTGPGHIAAACGVSVVSCFGPTSLRRSAPFGIGETVVLRNDALPCLECLERDGMEYCADGRPCMQGISREAVFSAIDALLRKRRRP